MSIATHKAGKDSGATGAGILCHFMVFFLHAGFSGKHVLKKQTSDKTGTYGNFR